MINLDNYLLFLHEGITDKFLHIKFLGKYDVTIDSVNINWKEKMKLVEKNFPPIVKKIASSILPLYKKQCLKIKGDNSNCNLSFNEFVKLIPLVHISFYKDENIEGCKLLFNAKKFFENSFISANLKNFSAPNSVEINIEG